MPKALRIDYPGAALARWLREGTTVSLEWVSRRMGMGGHPGNVSQGSGKLGPSDIRRYETVQSKLKRLRLAEKIRDSED